MRRNVSVVILVIALLCSGTIGLISAPAVQGNSQGESDFSASATLLKTTGSPGEYMLPEPPGFRPGHCGWESDVLGTGHPYSFITINGAPVAYRNAPIDLINQEIDMVAKLYRRLPSGALQLVDSFVVNSLIASPGVPADFNNRFGIMGMAFIADNGSKFLLGVELRWYNASDQVMGTADILYTNYVSPPQTQIKNSCDPFLPTTASLGLGQGTVNQTIPFTITRFPADPNVSIYFDGILIGSVATSAWGEGTGSFIVPARPMGPHTVKFYRYGRTATATFTIKPRIKIIPDVNVMRDQTVNVSLRGFTAHESVRIRWKKGSSWVQIATVNTSSTGSANINVKVPKFVPNGSTSVRGDGRSGHAQTNAVTVTGGPLVSSSAKPTPTPTKISTATPTRTPIPATSTPTSTIAPTQTVASPSATAMPTETATPEPTETPIFEPTTSSIATVEPTASGESG